MPAMLKGPLESDDMVLGRRIRILKSAQDRRLLLACFVPLTQSSALAFRWVDETDMLSWLRTTLIATSWLSPDFVSLALTTEANMPLPRLAWTWYLPESRSSPRMKR